MTEAERERAFPIELRTIPARHVAYIRVTNAFKWDRVVAAFRTLLDWARSAGHFNEGTVFGMSIDDPAVTPRHLYRYEACIAPAGSFDCPDGISRMRIPERTYAVTRVDGDIGLVATAWDYLFRGWLIRSEHEPEHAPAFEIFLESDRVLDWSSFHLDLCLPIKTMTKGVTKWRK